MGEREMNLISQKQAVSWSGLSRPSIHQLAQVFAESWILGTTTGVTVIPEFREAKYPGPRATSSSVEFVAPGSRLSALLRSGRDDN
jgi:hypothetical protein